jgi:hypothetical protein
MEARAREVSRAIGAQGETTAESRSGLRAVSSLVIGPRAVRRLQRDRGLTLQAVVVAPNPTHCCGESERWLGFAGMPPKLTANSGARASADLNSRRGRYPAGAHRTTRHLWKTFAFVLGVTSHLLRLLSFPSTYARAGRHP